VRLDHLLSKELSTAARHASALGRPVGPGVRGVWWGVGVVGVVVRPTPRPNVSGVVLMGGTSTSGLLVAGSPCPSTPAPSVSPLGEGPAGGGWIGWVGHARVGRWHAVGS
jgi:hypothetical protein